MNKLSKTQRDQLMAMAMAVVLLMGALWYFGVTAKQDELKVTRNKTVEMEKKLRDAEDTMRRSDEVDSTLAARSGILAAHEASLPPARDAYAWVISTVNTFIQSHPGIHIDTYGQPDITDSGFIPKFPYQWATFRVKGTGYYQDAGKFFADFENAFPYFSIKNPNLSANTGSGLEAEKLSVTFDLVVPVTDTK